MHVLIQSANFSHQRTHKSTHYHDCHEIIYITKGSAQIQVNKNTYNATQGDLVIFSRFEEHAVASRTDDYERYVFQISPDIPADPPLSKVFSILFNRPQRFCNVLNCTNCEEDILLICQRILKEKEANASFCNDMLNLLVQQLLIVIYRQLPDVFAVFDESSFDTVQQIQRRMEQSFHDQFSLSSLSAEYGFSISYLSHLFKRITGNSVMGYLQSCRMAAAKKYLAETDLEVGAIVDKCGFSDSSNFSRSFKRVTGSTPTKFRAQFNTSRINLN